MSGILKGLEAKIEKKIEEKMIPVVKKVDEMIKVLEKIEKNTRGKK